MTLCTFVCVIFACLSARDGGVWGWWVLLAVLLDGNK